MSKLHIANTFFEWELETQSTMSLKEAPSKLTGLLPEFVETKQRKKIRFSRNLEILSECYLQQYHVQAKSVLN